MFKWIKSDNRGIRSSLRVIGVVILSMITIIILIMTLLEVNGYNLGEVDVGNNAAVDGIGDSYVGSASNNLNYSGSDGNSYDNSISSDTTSQNQKVTYSVDINLEVLDWEQCNTQLDSILTDFNTYTFSDSIMDNTPSEEYWKAYVNGGR